MSFWTRNPYETNAKVAESLSRPPSGGRLRMWLLGVALALLPIYYAIRCWLTDHAVLIGRHGTRLDLTGPAARGIAVAAIAVALFMHAHWFWGLHPRLAGWSPILKVPALLLFLAAFGYTAYHILSR